MEEKQKYYCSFIKVGNKEFMEKLFYDGEIFCNTLDYFQNLPQENLMADPNDGDIKLIQAKNIKLEFKDKTFLSDKGQIHLKNPNLKGNLYCLYGVETKTIEPSETFKKLDLDLSAIDWGDYAIYIFDTLEFLRRMEAAIKKEQLQFEFHPVLYYDDKIYEGDLNVFNKSIKFEKQKEIRYWIANTNNEPIKLYLGDLSDISILLNRNELQNIEYDYK
ncbi:hypothetical protein FMM05_20375 [Flavobacterium zepuense]|uniref:Uncharacterized protein n=1 Tax=Flavobacterium zepuense TaxID=2593302 RepID=A0A552UT98_9FLAO|nr:hypothetical protein [Flavobacterium zepuense]TRW21434.1 hypothetical protein FMM05_20375 [Flavobacterium zepuense]